MADPPLQAAVMKQEIGFFDTTATTGVLLQVPYTLSTTATCRMSTMLLIKNECNELQVMMGVQLRFQLLICVLYDFLYEYVDCPWIWKDSYITDISPIYGLCASVRIPHCSCVLKLQIFF